MTDQKVLVVGSAGQVAKALVAAPPAGTSVVALGRPQLDLSDRSSIKTAVAAIQPDLVINAAAYTAVDQAESDAPTAFAVNASGAGFLAESAAKLNAPILHLSTDYVFNGEKPSPYTETDPVDPLGAYGRSKLAGELAVASANPRHFIFRTAWVYSAVGKNFVKTMLRLAETREELGVVHDQIGNPTSAADIAAALWRVSSRMNSHPDAASPGIYNMAGSGQASWAEFADEIFRVSAEFNGPSARVRRITTADYPTPTRRPANSRLDGSKLSAAFGVDMPHWKTSTQVCVQELIKSRGWAS